MPMLIDLNSPKYRDPWRSQPVAVALLYFFAFGQKAPRFYKVGLVHQSRDWRNLWYMLDGRRATHCRSFRADAKVLLPWSFAFLSPSHHLLWYSERRIKQDIRDQGAWARRQGEAGYTETFPAHMLERALAVMEDAKKELLRDKAPQRFRPTWPGNATELISEPLSFEHARAVLLTHPSQQPTTVAGFGKAIRELGRPS